jgi:hypothetical protein
MKTNAPRYATWLISLALGVLGVLGKVADIPFLSAYSFWLVLAGLILLLLANVLRGL